MSATISCTDERDSIHRNIERTNMIQVYQLNDDAFKASYPATPFTYGIGKFDPIASINDYEHVATLDVDNLNDAFEVGNIGPEEKYTRFKPMHSVSVGDILVDDQGTVNIVAPHGFDVLDVEIDLDFSTGATLVVK